MFTLKHNQEGPARTETRRSPSESVETRRPFVVPQLEHQDDVPVVTHDSWSFS